MPTQYIEALLRISESTAIICPYIINFLVCITEMTCAYWAVRAVSLKCNAGYFTFMWPCIVTNFFSIKPTRRTNFPNFILPQKKTSTCFGHFLCPSSGVIYCTFGSCIFLAGLMTASQQGLDKMKFGKFVGFVGFIEK